LPRRLRESVRTTKARTGAKLKGRSGARFFSIPHNDNAGAIRINVAGRDPHGIVPPGRAYDDLCIELTERLLQLRDASGTRPLVSRVVKTHEVFSGPQLDTLPDLMAVWNRDADTSAACSPDIGRVTSPGSSHRSGDHSTHGLLISDLALDAEHERPLFPAEVTPLLLEAARLGRRVH
jgi:predicted AlkP superfamily phosphohydrolase/phosphomutase